MQSKKLPLWTLQYSYYNPSARIIFVYYNVSLWNWNLRVSKTKTKQFMVESCNKLSKRDICKLVHRCIASWASSLFNMLLDILRLRLQNNLWSYLGIIHGPLPTYSHYILNLFYAKSLLISNFHISRPFIATVISTRIREENFGNAKPANKLSFQLRKSRKPRQFFKVLRAHCTGIVSY